MLQPELLLFSRSLSSDYRWMYCSEFISQADREVLGRDYRLFDQDKAVALSEKRLYVRWLTNSIVLYSFCRSTHRDENSRPIYALVGLAFSGFDRNILEPLLHIVAASLFVEPGSLFDCDSWRIADSTLNQSYSISISIDEMVKRCRMDSKTYSLMEKIHNTKVDIHTDALEIKSEEICVIRPQPTTPNNPLFARQNDTSIKRPPVPNESSTYPATPKKSGIVGWIGSLLPKKENNVETQNQSNKNDDKNSSFYRPY